MTAHTIHHAKTQLSNLVACALAGEEVIIRRSDTPAVRLAALDAENGARPRRPQRRSGT